MMKTVHTYQKFLKRNIRLASVEKDFLWDGEQWLIPAVYSGGKGLVIDFLKKVPADSIQDFMDKWHLGADSNCEDFNSEQQLLLDLDNPLTVQFFPKVRLNNNQEMTVSQSVSNCWNPVFSEFNSMEAQMALQHYELDPAFGWVIFRSFFPWKTKRKPQIKSLTVQMSAQKQAVPGPHFRVKALGDKVVFTCPITGKEHTLTVQEYTFNHIDTARFHNPAKEYPGCYTIIGYTITPALPKGGFSLADCSEGDNPRELQDSLSAPTSAECVSVIIGGADGPTALFFSDSKHPEMLYATSAPHFEPVKDVEWRMIFHEQRRSDISVKLI